MSLSGSILALLLMVGKPLYRNKLHQSFQYYLWLVVLAVLLLPVSKLVQVLANSALPMLQPILNEIVTQNIMTSDELAEYLGQMQATDVFPSRDGAVVDQMGQSGQTAMSDKTDLSEWMIFLYPLGVGIVLLYNLLTYQLFCIRLKRSATLTPISSPVPIYQSKLAQTPMLVGIFQPKIYLPKREFTKSQLKGVLSHEMVHYRRKDILIKWLSVLTCAVHWFNPIVWLTRREISRACELSCDEAVITGLDAAGRQMYGDTLILVAADDHRVRPTLAMGEDKRELKERLANIMKRKKHTRVAVTILVGLLTISAAAVTVLGAGSQENEAQKQTDQVQT
jgi:beta-lactamase regulating signal transducer with metallopeptidase domain